MGCTEFPPSLDDNPKAKGMPGWFLTETYIQFSLTDRLRLLLAGKVKVRIENRRECGQSMKCSASVTSKCSHRLRDIRPEH